eukprot:1202946-Prymnesium_polylepis.1
MVAAGTRRLASSDATTLALVAEQTHGGYVRSVGFSSDGTRIVSGSGVSGSGSGDNSVKVWGRSRSLTQCSRALVVTVRVQWAG